MDDPLKPLRTLSTTLRLRDLDLDLVAVINDERDAINRVVAAVEALRGDVAVAAARMVFVQAVALTDGSGVRLAWDADADAADDVLVQYRPAGEPGWVLYPHDPVTGAALTVTGVLLPETAYQFRVAPVVAGQAGRWVTAAAPVTLHVGQAPQPLPDVRVADITVTPAIPRTGPVALTATVTNVGDAATPDATGVSFRVDGVPVGWAVHPYPIAPGETVTVDAGGDGWVPATARTYRVAVSVNDAQRYPDKNPAANTTVRAVTVLDPDLFLGGDTFDAHPGPVNGRALEAGPAGATWTTHHGNAAVAGKALVAADGALVSYDTGAVDYRHGELVGSPAGGALVVRLTDATHYVAVGGGTVRVADGGPEQDVAFFTAAANRQAVEARVNGDRLQVLVAGEPVQLADPETGATRDYAVLPAGPSLTGTRVGFRAAGAVLRVQSATTVRE